MRRELTLPLKEFDRQVLPAHSRGGKQAVVHDAIGTYLRQQFKKLGGSIQKIEFTQTHIRVVWNQLEGETDPIAAVAPMLKSGQYPDAMILLKLLLSDDLDNPEILYNLGIACSDTGKIDQAIDHLGHLVEVDPDHTNGQVALGVALARKGDREGAREHLERAVALEPSNPWAQRNLGAALMQLGRTEEGVEHLREAAGLNPTDELAWYGLAQALEIVGDDAGADEAYLKVLELNEFGDVAEMAREGRTRIVQRTMRENVHGGLRMDAVMYMVTALGRFDAMTLQQVQDVAYEIAFLGRQGLDLNDARTEYTLRTLPGQFTAMQLVSIMYAAFQQIAPVQDVGIDLSLEYAMAQQLHKQPGDRTS